MGACSEPIPDVTLKGATTAYDALGRVTSSSVDINGGAIGTTTQYQNPFKKRFTNGRGHVTTTEYLAFDTPSEDLPWRIVEPLSTTTEIVRNEIGNPKTMTRAGTYLGSSIASTRTYVYDTHHRLCKTVEPETFATIVGYDLAGNVEWRAPGQNFSGYALANDCKQASVPSGQKTSFGYDQRDRLLSTVYGDGSPSVNTTYHATGLPWTVNSNGNNWTYLYNGRGQLESETLSSGGNSFAIGHAYNANGHEASLTYPGSVSVDFLPNGAGEPTKVGTYATITARHLNGAVNSFTYGNAITHTMTQTLHGLPDVVTDAGAAANVIGDNYDWDENGNVVAITNAVPGAQRTRTMTYDARDRLESTNLVDHSAMISFTYDPLDNLRNYFTPYRFYTHTYDPSTWRLSGIINSTSATMYSYDYAGDAGKRGNVTTRVKFGVPTPTQNYAFDQGNRLSSVSGSVSETYTYDGHGRRATSQIGSGPKKYQVYSSGGKLLQVGLTGAAGTERYIYLGAHLVAKVITGSGGSTTTRYQHTDGVGTPVAETDASGNLVGSRQLHEPYGLWSIGTLAQGPSFTGHVYDAQTELNYMQQRYYDPVAGRFLSVDPVAADAGSGSNFNRYWYANNNPYTFIDPDGRLSMKDHPSLRDFVKTIVVSAAANLIDRGAKAAEKVMDEKVAEARHEVKSRTSVKGELGAAGGLGGKVSAETDLYGNKKIGGVMAVGYGYSGTVTGEFEVAQFDVSKSANTFLKIESAEITLAAGPAIKLSVDFDPGGTASIKIGAGFGFGGKALINKPLSLGVEKEFPQ